MDTLIKNITIITMNRDQKVIQSGYLGVENGKISTIGDGEASIEIEEGAKQVINGKGKWALPGLINTHGHIGMGLLRGHADDLPLHRWLEEKMWPFEGQLDREAVFAARQLAMVEMVKSGTTTFLEMYHLWMDDLAEEVERNGMKAVLMRSMIGLCSEEEQKAKLQEAVAFAKAWNRQANGRIQTMMAPHAPYTCPPAFIERITEAAREENLGLHMHIAETKKEVEDHVNLYGMHPLNHLKELGVFENTHWLLAHCVHIGEEQIELLKSYPIHVSHNPMSNLKLGSGIAPVGEMLAKGINVALGTDSVASNNHLDLIEEMRFAALLQKGRNLDPTVLPAEEALMMATRNGALALGLDGEVGTLQKGAEADVILVKANEAHLQPWSHPFSHAVYALKGADVTDVFVQGVQLMENRQLKTLDEEKIVAEANKHYERMLTLL
ncbi:amidohydrolase [Halalkalibacterium ligniniphilum]|uniref:amidohydrolase n=1 Tax=Halalkalibacterium ligniniphilum TaxID=1134413 RepID=UPI00034D2CC4|nr:amidohydrolase [Halalkalibacterium ligniniphilum]